MRSVTSRMAAETIGPSSVSSADRLISAGNSVPSLCRAARCMPAPLGRGVGWGEEAGGGVRGVHAAGAVRDEDLDGPAEQLLARVSEQALGLGIDQGDLSVG